MDNLELAQEELEKVERWVRKSYEPYDDWDWDGEVLTIFIGESTEKYDKETLIEEGIL